MNGKLDDVPKAFCILEKNGTVEIKFIPMDQLSIVYINDSTQQRAEAYIKYEFNCTLDGHKNLYYDYSDVKLDNLNNYMEVTNFNISNYNCYSIHPYNGDYSGLKNCVHDLHYTYPGIDPNTTIYYKLNILEKNIAHLSNMKNIKN